MGRHKKITDEEMLQGARDCFLKHGPQVSTALIADCLGVSQAAIFKRFPTKKHLVIAALAPPLHPVWLDRVDAGPDDRSIQDQLREVAELLNQHTEKILPQIHTLRAYGIEFKKVFENTDYPPPLQIVKAISMWFERAQAKGLIRTFNPDTLALFLVGSIQSRVLAQFIMQRPNLFIDAQKHIDQLVDIILYGVMPEGDH